MEEKHILLPFKDKTWAVYKRHASRRNPITEKCCKQQRYKFLSLARSTTEGLKKPERIIMSVYKVNWK